MGRKRLQESCDELRWILRAEDLSDAAVLVFANKQDDPNAVPVAEVTDKFSRVIQVQKWHVQPTCATSGHGLIEGLQWLVENMTEFSVESESSGLCRICQRLEKEKLLSFFMHS